MKTTERVLLCCVAAWFCCVAIECHEDLFDADGNTLKEGNSTVEGRSENGVINATSTHEDLLVKSHPDIILSGTGYKVSIKIPGEVCESNFPKCTETGGSCNVRVEEERENPTVQCECPDKSVYEEGKGCTVSVEVCKSEFPGCMDTGGKCNVDVGNEDEQSVVQCECPVKTWYIKGAGCEECNCGDHSFGCYFENNEKKCNCYFGYGPKDGVCTECDCGEESFGCRFEKGEKKCECLSRYGQKDGICIDCGCGYGVANCSFDGDNKICNCAEDYVLIGDQCKRCYCGYNSTCRFENGEKICDCMEGFMDIDGWCKACDCGPYSTSCRFENGETKCDCMEGFMDINGWCRVESQSGLSAAEIAGIVVGKIVFIALLSALCSAFWSKKSQLQKQVSDHSKSSVSAVYNSGSGNVELQAGS